MTLAQCADCGDRFEKTGAWMTRCWDCWHDNKAREHQELRDDGYRIGYAAGLAAGRAEQPSPPPSPLPKGLIRNLISLVHPSAHPAERADEAVAMTVLLESLLGEEATVI